MITVDELPKYLPLDYTSPSLTLSINEEEVTFTCLKDFYTHMRDTIIIEILWNGILCRHLLADSKTPKELRPEIIFEDNQTQIASKDVIRGIRAALVELSEKIKRDERVRKEYLIYDDE